MAKACAILLVALLALPSAALAQSGGTERNADQSVGEPLHTGGFGSVFGSATSSVKGFFGLGGHEESRRCEEIETNAAGEPIYAKKSAECP